MSDEHKYKCNDPECACAKDGGECNGEDHEIEVVELEDENGDKEEFAILDEIDFEGRHFVIMTPLVEFQALRADDDDADVQLDLSIEIFETSGDDFTVVEDEDLAKRLMEYLDQLSQELED
jgi:hypothetical protein